MHRNLHEANRLPWNASPVAHNSHNSHKGARAAFFRAGGCTQFPEEPAQPMSGLVAAARA